ncbi:MAG: four helix bundle protein [Patescibacteria group bacterium]
MSLRFEDLKVYNQSLNLVGEIYQIVKKFPKEEQYILVDQLKRASISIVLNIAEGSGRSKKEFNHFLNTSRTSSYECVAALQIALRQNYLSLEEYTNLEDKIVSVIKMLNGLKKSLEKNQEQ